MFEAREGVLVGHCNVIRNVERVLFEENVVIGNFNWVAGAAKPHPIYYRDQAYRDPSLIMRRDSSLSSNHRIDCTDCVEIGAFTTIAGSHCEILTHSVDISKGRQIAGPVQVGTYCFVGSRSVLLKDSYLPDYSVLAAGSVLTKRLDGEYSLFGGVPARKIRDLSADSEYFRRTVGAVR